MSAAPYSVKPFSGSHYDKNSRRCEVGHPCAICGREVKNPQHWAIVVDGGAGWGDNRSNEKAPGYIGRYPIGINCHNKYVTKEAPTC